MQTTGRLEAIWLKRGHKGPMDAYERAILRAHHGLVGNADVGGKRQVTLLELERWQEMMEELGATLDPSARRANLLVSGIRLENRIGSILVVGQCQLRINGQSRPCERMDQVWPGLRQVMSQDWRGGVYAEVVKGGEIAVGDPVRWQLPR